VRDGVLRQVRRSEIAVQQLTDEADVLPPERVIQPELPAQVRELRRGRIGPEQDDLGRIARHQVDQQERDNRDPEDHGYCRGQPTQDVRQHGQDTVAVWNMR